jgi:hypothetical protein
VAISVPKRPALIVAGTVMTITPRNKFDDASKRYTDEVIGYGVSVSQESGAVLDVRFNLDRTGALPAPLPNLLDRVALVVDVNESREYGASLAVARYVSEDDLDRIHSMVLATLETASSK